MWAPLEIGVGPLFERGTNVCDGFTGNQRLAALPKVGKSLTKNRFTSVEREQGLLIVPGGTRSS